jgi:hypothetical protein
MSTLEQIIDEARSLSPAEKRKLRQVLDRDLEDEAQASAPGYRTFDREHAWLDANRDRYLGQWVAVEGDALVAHGTNPRQVYLDARNSGIDVPYVVKVEQQQEPYTGGWL